jgi:hypothetical protein
VSCYRHTILAGAMHATHSVASRFNVCVAGPLTARYCWSKFEHMHASIKPNRAKPLDGGDCCCGRPNMQLHLLTNRSQLASPEPAGHEDRQHSTTTRCRSVSQSVYVSTASTDAKAMSPASSATLRGTWLKMRRLKWPPQSPHRTHRLPLHLGHGSVCTLHGMHNW